MIRSLVRKAFGIGCVSYVIKVMLTSMTSESLRWQRRVRVNVLVMGIDSYSNSGRYISSRVLDKQV